MQLSSALKEARAALGTTDFAAAQAALDKAAPLAKLPEHQAAYERLKRLTGFVEEFQAALQASIETLEAGASVTVGSSTQVGVVETRSDSIILKVAGANRTYKIDDLPLGLAVALADHGQEKTPHWLIVKGGYVLAHQDAVEDAVEKAKQWWQEAAQAGGELGDLELLLEDDYEFGKVDLPHQE